MCKKYYQSRDVYAVDIHLHTHDTDVAEEVFNRCTSTNATKDGQILPDSPDYLVTFKYEFLEDFQDPTSRAGQLARALTRRCTPCANGWWYEAH